jgi:hypothetical protein
MAPQGRLLQRSFSKIRVLVNPGMRTDTPTRPPVVAVSSKKRLWLSPNTFSAAVDELFTMRASSQATSRGKNVPQRITPHRLTLERPLPDL